MKFVIDCYGGDFSPFETVKGICLALEEDKDISYVLTGKEEEIRKLLLEYKVKDMSRIEFINADEVFTNDDKPTSIVHEKDNTSLVKGLLALKERDDIDAFITSGSTGGTLAGSIFKVGRMKGIYRPCLMATLPTRTGKLVRMVDIGANMDPKPEYLLQYALMANEFVKLSGVDNPRIALLNVGKEEEKGNELTHAVYEMLSKREDINFVGNIEGDHVLKGEADIVVSDAFSGNVFIKSLEETAYFVSDAFQAAIKKNIFTKLGALFQLHELKKVKKIFKYANEACAPLLGIKKLVVKMHGKSKANNVKSVILEVKNLVSNKLIEKIENLTK